MKDKATIGFSYYYNLLPRLNRTLLFEKFLSFLDRNNIVEPNKEAKTIFLELLIITVAEDVSFNESTYGFLKNIWKETFPKFNKASKYAGMRFSYSLDLTYNEEEALDKLFEKIRNKVQEFLPDVDEQVMVASYNKMIYPLHKGFSTGPITATSVSHGFIEEIVPRGTRYLKRK